MNKTLNGKNMVSLKVMDAFETKKDCRKLLIHWMYLLTKKNVYTAFTIMKTSFLT